MQFSVISSQLIWCYSLLCTSTNNISTMKKYTLLIVGIKLLFGNTCGLRHCPSNCDCSSEFWSTCVILYCDDDLDLATPFLTIL